MVNQRAVGFPLRGQEENAGTGRSPPLFSLAILQPHSMAVGSGAAGQEGELSAKQGLSLP